MKEITNTGTKKGRDHYSHAKLDAYWDKLREQAEDRQEAHNKLTLKQKLDKAYKRVSEGKGECKREIARYTKLLKLAKPAKAEPVLLKSVKSAKAIKMAKQTK
jgi:hypothetical protein